MEIDELYILGYTVISKSLRVDEEAGICKAFNFGSRGEKCLELITVKN